MSNRICLAFPHNGSPKVRELEKYDAEDGRMGSKTYRQVHVRMGMDDDNVEFED